MSGRSIRLGGMRHVRTLWLGLAGLVALAAAQSAPAAIVESTSINTIYGYGFLGTPRIFDGENFSFRDGGSVAGFPAEFGLDFTTRASNDGFFFLHNQYCVGRCTVYTQTTVTVSITNTGDTAEALRFDSQITPGHLARQGINTNSTAEFDFRVSQTTAGGTRELYSAIGATTAASTNITTSDGVGFNGLTRSSNGDSWEVLDWSATNLNLLLDAIQPGETSTLTYRSFTRTSTTMSECPELIGCPGIQVAFGDPRNNGGGTNLGDFRALAPDPDLTQVIGRLYGARQIMVDIVAADAPLPPRPDILPPVTYGAPFRSQVPEPATWAMLIMGFGLIGQSARRSRVRIVNQQYR